MLKGQRVLFVRPEGQAEETIAYLNSVGATPISIPLLELVPAHDPEPLRRALAALPERYDWVVFTSANAARFVVMGAQNRGDAAPRLFHDTRVIAIGPATAKVLSDFGIRVDTIPDEFVSEGLVSSLLEGMPTPPPRVLIPRAERGRDVLPLALREAGCEVDVVVAYTTVRSPADKGAAVRDLLRARGADALFLTSGSSAAHLAGELGAELDALLSGVTVCGIGPATTEEARRHGFHVSVTASTHTTRGMVDALSEYLARTPAP